MENPISFLKNFLAEMEKWPVGVLLVVAMVFIGEWMEGVPWIRNEAIKTVMVVLGVIIYPVLNHDPATLFPVKTIMLQVLTGLILGSIAVLMRRFVLKPFLRVIAKRVQNGDGTTTKLDGNTTIVEKPKE